MPLRISAKVASNICSLYTGLVQTAGRWAMRQRGIQLIPVDFSNVILFDGPLRGER
jgi:hypothetical protein